MVSLFSREFGLFGLLACGVVLALPLGVFAECRVVEYPDRSEVVCGDDAPQDSGQPERKGASKLETTKQKEFVFHAPVSPVTKITVSADLSPFAIASPGDTLFSYRADVLRDKVYTATSATFVYEELTEDATFTIREEGGSPQVKNVTFNDKRNHLLLMPFNSGCSSNAADGVYLKMNRIEGSQLHYQIVLPPCLSKLVEQSITD
jgi:hypothetical protein